MRPRDELRDNNEKVIIENSYDLYKIPISTLKNTKIYNFKGKYYDKIFEEALKIERSGGRIDPGSGKPISFTIDTICFEIPFVTEFGQRIGISGSLDQLGSWDQKRFLPLEWNEGNLWRAQITFSDRPINFEYKFLFVEHDKIKKWESGQNREFKLELIKSEFENELTKLSDLQTNVSLENLNEQRYIYDANVNSLKIISKWK
jgi:hypothetical protein